MGNGKQNDALRSNPPLVEIRAEGGEVNRRLKVTLITIVGAALAVVGLLRIELTLIDSGDW